MNILLLSGGNSAEREVSLRSGLFVEAGLREAGHRVLSLDPGRVPLDTVEWSRFDCCFPVLHGGAGEDGRLQRFLERRRIPFVGSGSAASGFAMHKAAAKERFRRAGLPTPDYAILSGGSRLPLEAVMKVLPAPWVVKPESQGSSIGVRFLSDSRQLKKAIKNALLLSPYVIVERAVVGRELTVGVMDRTPLPVLEIVHGRAVYDEQAKYFGDPAWVRPPEGLGPIPLDTVTRIAVEAAHALGTTGLVRVDLILDNRGIPWILEVNTIPGLTATSLAPKAAAACGYDRPGLCERMLESCHGRFGNTHGEEIAYRRGSGLVH